MLHGSHRLRGVATAALILLSALFSFEASGAGGLADGQWDPRAANALSSAKLKFGFASDAAFVNARIAECAARGVPCDSIPEGMMFWRTDINVVRVCLTAPCTAGGGWSTYNPLGGAGSTLDDVYTAGQTIARDLLSFKLTDALANATHTLWLARTAGTGAVINIDNTGSGPDILGDYWSVDTAGKIAGTGLDMGDDRWARFGASQDMTLGWDTTGTDHFNITPLAANQQVDFGTDGVGLDLLYNSGVAGDFFRFDASDKMLYGEDVHFKMGDSDKIYLGTATGAANVAGDFEVYYDGADLYFYPLAVGDGVVFGQGMGDGVDVTIFGDGLTSSAKFDYDAAGDALIMTDYEIQMVDGTPIVFGTGTGVTGDLVFTYTGGLTDDLGVTQTVAGTGTLSYGVSGKGISTTWFTETVSSTIILDQADDELEFTAANAHLLDASKVVYGTGAGAGGTAAGDMSMSYAGGFVNLLSLNQSVAGTGALAIGVDGKGIDTTLYEETAGDYWKLDQTTGTLVFEDTEASFSDGASAYFGATNTTTPADGVALTGTASNLKLDSVAVGGADVTLGSVQPTDLSLWGTNGAGAAASLVRWDYATDTLQCLTTLTSFGAVRMSDTAEVEFGNLGAGDDVHLSWDVTDNIAPGGQLDYLHFENGVAANQAVVFGVDGAGMDLVAYGDTAGSFLFWKQADDTLRMVQSDLLVPDVSGGKGNLIFGTDGDILINYTGMGDTLNIGQKAPGTGSITVGVDGKGIDTTWFTDTASSLIKMDQVNDQLVFTAANSHLQDTSRLIFGSGAGMFITAAGDMNLSYAGGTETLSMQQVTPGTGTVEVGVNGKGITTTFFTETAGSKIVIDQANERLSFNGVAGSWYADNATITWGNVVGTPDMMASWNATTLLFDTGAAANAAVQFGTAAALHQVTVNFGDPATAAIEIDGNSTAGSQIEYKAQFPVDKVFIPAGAFIPGTHDPVISKDTNLLGYGWNLIKDGGLGHNHAIQTMWLPPIWMDTTIDVTAYIDYTCGALGATNWILNYLKITPGMTLTSAAGTDVLATDTPLAAMAYDSTIANKFTIPAATFSNSAHRPVKLNLSRDDTDTNLGDCIVFGMTLEVTRKYVD